MCVKVITKEREKVCSCSCHWSDDKDEGFSNVDLLSVLPKKWGVGWGERRNGCTQNRKRGPLLKATEAIIAKMILGMGQRNV